MILSKVTMGYEDGTIKELSGEAAQEWLKTINNVLILHQVRGGMQLDMPEWVDVVKPQEAE